MVHDQFWKKMFFHPFLTHCCSQNGPFSRHFEIYHGPKRATMDSKRAKNTEHRKGLACLGTILEKFFFLSPDTPMDPLGPTQEDHLILLREFFDVCQQNHTRLKLEKCEFMHETMQYLGFYIGYGWWTRAVSKSKPLMDARVRHEYPKKGLHDVRSFIGACNFYRRHIKKFTYTSAILTDLIGPQRGRDGPPSAGTK